jgi:secretion/DNA translocation related CpaE-like protein
MPLVVTADLELLDGILAAAAAAGVEPTVTAETASLRPQWATAPVVVVGSDRAPQVAEMMLPHRTEVYVVGSGQGRDDVLRWSAPLGAAVVTLPDDAGLLTAAIADATGRPAGSGSVVAFAGASGGVGCSSASAALAVGAVARGLPTVLIDLDRLGGGIDLLVGAEGVAGWRWPRLEGAQGHLGDLTGHLPRVGGMDVLSTSRDDGWVGELEPGTVRSVLQSVTRSHRLAVLDIPRGLGPAGREGLRDADLALLVVSGDVRGVAAAQQWIAAFGDATADLRVVVRRPRVGAIEPQVVAEALALRLAGIVAEDTSLPRAAERGDPPGRSGRGGLAKLSRRLLDELELATEVAR